MTTRQGQRERQISNRYQKHHFFTCTTLLVHQLAVPAGARKDRKKKINVSFSFPKLPVLQEMNSAIHRIKHYSVGILKSIALSFEQLGPKKCTCI